MNLRAKIVSQLTTGLVEAVRAAGWLLVATQQRQPEVAILVGPEGGEIVREVPRVERPLFDPTLRHGRTQAVESMT